MNDVKPGRKAVGTRVVPLTAELLRRLPSEPRDCLLWELDPVRRDRVAPEQRGEAKVQWFRDVTSAWGNCGFVVVVDDEPRGIALYAPAAFAPGTESYPTAPISPDAVVLTSLWVHPQWRGRGFGRRLIHRVAHDLTEREAARALETFATTGEHECLPPSQFMIAVGFVEHRAHPHTPRMRLDLRRILTVRGTLGAALSRIRGWLRPASPVVEGQSRERTTTPRNQPDRQAGPTLAWRQRLTSLALRLGRR